MRARNAHSRHMHARTHARKARKAYPALQAQRAAASCVGSPLCAAYTHTYARMHACTHTCTHVSVHTHTHTHLPSHRAFPTRTDTLCVACTHACMHTDRLHLHTRKPTIEPFPHGPRVHTARTHGTHTADTCMHARTDTWHAHTHACTQARRAHTHTHTCRTPGPFPHVQTPCV